jgi:ubiquinone/menaquinone biosynthesis C-methylase UbiE
VLKDIGERFMPDWKGETALEHLHRYELMLEFAAGKRVLDVASGEGYGSARLASVAQSVIGVDVSLEAVEHARERYVAPNLQFKHGSAAKLPLEDRSVEVAISFETLEHLTEQEEMVSELARVLTPDGLLIISTPDKHFYTDLRNHQNPFHHRELYRPEFVSLLRGRFAHTELWLQRSMHASFIVPEVPGPGTNIAFTHDSNTGQVVQEPAIGPLYLVALASNVPLTKRLGASTFEIVPPGYAQVEQELRQKYHRLEQDYRGVVDVLERTVRDLVAAEREQRRLTSELAQHQARNEPPSVKSVLSGARDLLRPKRKR